MKTFTTIFLMMILSVSVLAGYTYTITGGYFEDLTLRNSESLLMTGGGGYRLTGEDYCVLDIMNTSPLAVDIGGIWNLIVTDNSRLNFYGGQVRQLDIGDYAMAILSSGRIDKIASGYYSASVDHIEIICKDHDYNSTSKILTGTWENDSAFNIQLIDIGYGYTPTYNNIKFTIIPEPATLLLLAVGGLLLKRR